MRIRLLVGLPGAGKTTYGKSLQAKDPDILFLDDATDKSPWPDPSTDNITELIVASPNFCREKTRQAASSWILKKYPHARLEWIYFAPDIQACRQNVKDRSDGRDVEATMNIMSRFYDIPPDTPLLPVYKAPAPAR